MSPHRKWVLLKSHNSACQQSAVRRNLSSLLLSAFHGRPVSDCFIVNISNIINDHHDLCNCDNNVCIFFLQYTQFHIYKTTVVCCERDLILFCM